MCKKDCPEYGTIFVNMDGDPVCSKECESKHKADKDYFLNVAIHDDEKFAAYMGVNIDEVRNNI